jgi:peptide/nickel transport system ATP-binding protein
LTGTARNKEVLLDVRDLSVHYHTPLGDVKASNRVSFSLFRGELLGLVGESGCGKSSTAMAILRLVQPPGRIAGGSAVLDGEDLLALSPSKLREVRWKKMALVPQGAMNSLNPLLKIKDQFADAITTHERGNSRKALKERILGLLRSAGLPDRVYSQYPHELSGGMKQRVCMGMAIALNPILIVADEPTSALDVVVQRRIAQTLIHIKERMGISMIVIGHDMGLMAQLVDRIAVMYAGHLVEIAPVRTIYKEPLHPYTQLLIQSIPSIKERRPLKITQGLTHDLRNPPPGCIFHTRCARVFEECKNRVPSLIEVRPGHFTACHLHKNGTGDS